MSKWTKVFALAACMGLAQSAFAIPLAVEITSSASAAGAGVWTLSGASSTSQFWAVGPGDTYTSGADVADGDYTWSILGAGAGFGAISWVLVLGNDQIYEGSDQGWLVFKVSDSKVFEVGTDPVSVPEPETLLLLGSGLVTMALSIRRKLKSKS